MNKQKQQKPNKKIRKGDTVRIINGKDKSKSGKVMAVMAAQGLILVEGVNMVKKHVRPKKAGEKGQRVSIAAPIDISNVQLVCPNCKKSTRVSIKREGDIRQRICKHCEGIIE